jgi:hypothetical protein
VEEKYGPEEVERRWLRFELWGGDGVHNGLFHHIHAEAHRIEPLFNRSAEWRAWWSTTSKAPALDLSLAIVWPDRTPQNDFFIPQRVARGRKQHFVRLHIDAGQVEAVPKENRRSLTVPAVLEALRRLTTELKLDPPPERLPAGVQPDH